MLPDPTEPSHIIFTLRGSNLATPIRVTPSEPVEYLEEEFMQVPFEMYVSETCIYLHLPEILHVNLHRVEDPMVDIQLIACPDHDKLLFELLNVKLGYDADEEKFMLYLTQ